MAPADALYQRGNERYRLGRLSGGVLASLDAAPGSCDRNLALQPGRAGA